MISYIKFLVLSLMISFSSFACSSSNLNSIISCENYLLDILQNYRDIIKNSNDFALTIPAFDIQYFYSELLGKIGNENIGEKITNQIFTININQLKVTRITEISGQCDLKLGLLKMKIVNEDSEFNRMFMSVNLDNNKIRSLTTQKSSVGLFDQNVEYRSIKKIKKFKRSPIN